MASNDESSPNTQRTQTGQSTNYYDLLGITPEATDEEIKRAYRKTALRLHPDKNPDPEAAGQFQAVDKAYKVLSDPRLRSTYDQLGPKAADAMRRMNDEYSEALARMPRWKKILFSILCISTCCCFGGGCCCLCGFGCCCNFCCNHCCGKYQRDPDPFSSFQDEEDTPGIFSQKNTTDSPPKVVTTVPKETDPVISDTSIPIPANYESTAETK